MTARLHTTARLAWAIALALWTAACASSGQPAPKPFPMPEPRVARRGTIPRVDRPKPAEAPEPLPAAPAGTTVDLLLRTALDLRGTPYRNGGSDPQGFDCSGFTQWVFAKAGLSLPRETRDQYKEGTPIARGQVQPGDLVFFTTTARGASHVGIALGGDSFVHAPSSTGVVRVESMSLAYWDRRFVGIRRVVR